MTQAVSVSSLNPSGGGASLTGQALAVPVEPASGLAPTGFDPSRIALLAAKAKPLLDCGHLANRPNERVSGERVVGFVISQDDIGLGLTDSLFALKALAELAAIAIEAASAGETAQHGSTEGESAGRQASPETGRRSSQREEGQ